LPKSESRFRTQVPKKKNTTQISVYEMLMYDFQATYTELLFGSR